mmetsp:Transcript_6540/g.10994  ORF Transcript_6540/g.10994 Transcript_6540/m.10994 type:complete len:190 (-) Transcript_6540:352-921(-)|eukprot:CAMPEP_0184989880 /NCGR_PEP_ID=MMETSP1098-20130426/30536_1 /TAXON_ID=89044 /ORGANISM="Spumella elongata, Strain CCAP 955/1" /LENGTH=189 /DNA_ID=CAMNT_0027514975 /DNA_START=83 /DNA_END=652 /DNA_ORIENTATION=+
MNLGQFEELDAAMASKKRGRELAQAEQEMREAQEIEDKKNKANRGNYLCSRCNLPKKGHVCPFQPRYKRRDQSNDVGSAMVMDAAVQVEMDEDMTLKALGDLDKQGTAESYFASGPVPKTPSLSGLNESFQNVAFASSSSSSSSHITAGYTNTNNTHDVSTGGGGEGIEAQSGVRSDHSDSAQNAGSTS